MYHFQVTVGHRICICILLVTLSYLSFLRIVTFMVFMIKLPLVVNLNEIHGSYLKSIVTSYALLFYNKLGNVCKE
jgi:hypothetical protein